MIGGFPKGIAMRKSFSRYGVSYQPHNHESLRKFREGYNNIRALFVIVSLKYYEKTIQGLVYWNRLTITWLHLNPWGRVTHICVSKLTIIGSDNDMSHGRRQAINGTNAGILLMRLQWIINSYIFVQENASKMSFEKWLPFCLGLNLLRNKYVMTSTYNHAP